MVPECLPLDRLPPSHAGQRGHRPSGVHRFGDRHRRRAATWISWVVLGSGVSAVVQISKTATLCHFALTLVEFGVGAGARVIDGPAEAGGLHAGQSRPRFEHLACCARVALSNVHVREPGVHRRPSVISLMKVVKVAKLADTECISTQHLSIAHEGGGDGLAIKTHRSNSSGPTVEHVGLERDDLWHLIFGQVESIGLHLRYKAIPGLSMTHEKIPCLLFRQ